MNIKNKLLNEYIFFDGAMGSLLQNYGLAIGELPELLNIHNADLIVDVHKQYLNAGVDVITTNTFGAYSIKYDNLEDIIKAAIQNAKKAIDDLGLSNKFVALDMGSTGKLLKPLGDLAFSDAYEIFKQTAVLGEQYGADFVILETFTDIYEMKAAVLAIKENTSLPIFCTMTFDEKGRTLTGGDVLCMISLLESLSVDCIGLNCGLGPKQIQALYKDLQQYVSTPVIIQPNAGLPTIKDGKTFYDVSPAEFAADMVFFAENGATVLGGCCGTTPEHIKIMIDTCKKIPFTKVTKKEFTFVSSYGKAVLIGEKPVVVGERINPTGKKKLKEALRNHYMEYILNEATTQKNNNAHILDVNVGLPEIDEVAMMIEAIKNIQAISDLPLQIDSSSAEVIEQALKIYNGKALVNSVNGKKEIMESIFPIIKKYGGVIVGLTLDEDGIPATAEERFRIAENIVNTAQKYGIEKKNIIIDTLTLTISAQQEEARETLKALKMVKEKLGVKTILGVSNISFGLPNREIVTSTFFGLALNAGLDACIINPSSKAMMDTYYAYNAISGVDVNCIDYINQYTEVTMEATTKSDASVHSLKDLIIKGMKDLSYNATIQLLESMKPIDIINNELIPGLDVVGKGFESGKYFLPQLIISAEAAKKAFDAINEHLIKSGNPQKSKGKILLATVKGDIHDIGKNIVKALLENYGYEIVDLGKDVDMNLIVDTIKQQNIKLAGLSALMTTTVSNMEKTIKLIREHNLDCKVVVGGAVLTAEYAEMMGADYYAKDALASVTIAEDVFK